MRLDVGLVRYLTRDEYRVLVGIELSLRNHEIAPKELISQISKVNGGEAYKILSDLSTARLVTRVKELKHEGYKLTVSGYDYLALYTFSKQDVINGVGNKIGVGKESDVYLVSNEEGNNMVLKLHRLGRTSFRNVKEKRDYLGNRLASSWLYLSRLSAIREYSFMKLLFQEGFPVPEPIGQNRHAVVMSLVEGDLLQHVRKVDSVRDMYDKIINLLVRLAESGLIHGDYNEFNIMIDENEDPVLIDFPQMVSIDHRNAEMYFDRDIKCVKTFFEKKFKMDINADDGPTLNDVSRNNLYLDVRSKASGYKKISRKQLAKLMENNSNDIYFDNHIPSETDDLSEKIEFDYSELEKVNPSVIKNLINTLSELKVGETTTVDHLNDEPKNVDAVPSDGKTILNENIKKNFKKYVSKKYGNRRKSKFNIVKVREAISAREGIKNYKNDIWG